jgi:flagellar protein FlaI
MSADEEPDSNGEVGEEGTDESNSAVAEDEHPDVPAPVDEEDGNNLPVEPKGDEEPVADSEAESNNAVNSDDDGEKEEVTPSRPSRWEVTEDGTPPEADPEVFVEMLDAGEQHNDVMEAVFKERTVNIISDIDEEDFFGYNDNDPTIVSRYDLEKSVPLAKKQHFKEIQRYWVNRPYAFVSIFKSVKENEYKYYVIEPYLNAIEQQTVEFFSGKLRTAIKYDSEDIQIDGGEDARGHVIEDKARELLQRYDLYDPDSFYAQMGSSEGFKDKILGLIGRGKEEEEDLSRPARIDGMGVRPERVLLEENNEKLNSYQVEKLLYFLKRNFIGYERIDPVKYDINVEDISCDGYNSPVFVYHSEYEQIISNIVHGQKQLDDFVVKLAQRSGKAISKRLPQVDCTLPDGSRAQLTLGAEVSDHGTNYTIRQFKDVPFTPLDLIAWKTFGLDQMAFLWLCIENQKSLIFAGGTASGKTTSLNAVSLFIPSASKIVSIEDTREVELPQRNWIASVTRPSFSGDDKGNVDEFALLEAALRQRPEYIVMGEIRGEEGRTLFQVMSTGHTTYTTFHADSVGEVLKRFTTDPINVSKTLFSALDLVSIQTSTRVNGNKVRRNKTLTEINFYDAENDEINVSDVYVWDASDDVYLGQGENETVRGTNTIEEIMFDRGWTEDEVWDELMKRQLVLAYLIKMGLRSYAQVAATLQAFINDPETILTLIANDKLADSLEDLRDMESVLIDIEPDKEELVPRPEADEEITAWCEKTLEECQYLLDPFVGNTTTLGVMDALPSPSDIAGEEITPELEDGKEKPALEDGHDESDDSDVSDGDDESESIFRTGHEPEADDFEAKSPDGGDGDNQ